MKTDPMKHQRDGLAFLSGREAAAMGAEQGTGKTWMLLADAEQRFLRGDIRALLVVAPNGVHTNWVEKEIPKHLSVPCIATHWISGAGKKHAALLQRQLKFARGGEDDARHFLFIHAINIDALNTKSGYEHAKAFIESFRGKTLMDATFVVDESHIIKNPAAKRTKKVLELGRQCKVRRISSGTLVGNSPIDLFSQYELLGDGLLGTRSYRAFVAEYAELLPFNSKLVQDIIKRTGARGTPQILARDKKGQPTFKNLEKLTKLMAPHTFRVTKAECLDLPEKIYQTIFFDLTPEQRAEYDRVVAERRWIREDGTLDIFTAMTVRTKLRQITSGFIMEDGEPTTLAYAGARLEILRDVLESYPGQLIIWATFREEIAQIAALLQEEGVTFREYHGGVKRADRMLAVNDFQAGEARVFLANPAAAGTGLTLTAAETAVYFSNDDSLLNRSQSEDRNHRIGTVNHVVYIDIVARNTVDVKIAAGLQAKKYTAEAIMADL